MKNQIKKEYLMMKRFLSAIFALVLLTVSVSSCSGEINSAEEETTTYEEYLKSLHDYLKVDEYLKVRHEYLEAILKIPDPDPDKEKLPSYDDMLKIEYEMPYEEVYAIAGLPQRKMDNMRTPVSPKRSSTVPATWFFYDTSDGIEFIIAYSYSTKGIFVQFVTPWIPQDSTPK